MILFWYSYLNSTASADTWVYYSNFWMIIGETSDSVMLEGQITQIDITWRQNLGEVSKSANESI